VKQDGEEEMATLPKAAEELGVHHTTLWRMAEAGQFPARKIAGRYVIPRSKLEAFKLTFKPRPPGRPPKPHP
jgi:excisionase family DNA binding protein